MAGPDRSDGGRRLMTRMAPILAIAFVLAVGAMPASAQKNIKFVMDWTFQSNHGYFTMADDKGHFAKEGIKVKIDRGYGSGKTIAQVAGGSYDFGFADINVIVKFNAKNPGNKVFSPYVVFDATLSSVVALKKSGIRKPKDLIGRSLAAPVWDNSRILFPIFARANGFDPAAVKWQSVSGAIRDSLMITGKADGVTGFATSVVLNMAKQKIPRKDVVVMRYSEYGADFFGQSIIVSEKFASANPGLIKGFIRAIIKGTREAMANPKAAVASVMRYDKLMKQKTEMQRFAMVRDLAVLTPSVKANGFSHVDPKRLKRTIGFVAKAMKIDNPPPPRDVFRGDYLPPASQRMP
jgi:NitT/TauT family transport system substrate-binding protein